MVRIVVSAFLALALWITGGFFAFLLLPVLSDLSLGTGVLAGILAFVAQLLWGRGLVKRLLRWQKPSDLKQTEQPSELGELTESEQILTSADAFIDSDCPQVLYLQDVCCTTGALKAGITDAQIAEWRKVGPTPAECYYLSSMLALPCLFRAFEAVTNSYGKLRLSEGPLWYLGRFFAFWARLLEWPLRSCWGEKRPACALHDKLSAELLRCDKIPAWMRALDLISPLSVARTVQQFRWQKGQEQLPEKERSAVPECFLAPSRFALWGAEVGLVLALSPEDYWGALPLGLGLGLFLSFLERHPGGTRAVKDKSWFKTKSENKCALAVRGKGRIERAPAQMAFDRVCWCWRSSAGLVALGRVPHGTPLSKWAEEGTEVEMQGWFNCERVALQIEKIQNAQDIYRDRYRLKYGGWPLLLAGCGAAWWYLQIIGL